MNQMTKERSKVTDALKIIAVLLGALALLPALAHSQTSEILGRAQNSESMLSVGEIYNIAQNIDAIVGAKDTLITIDFIDGSGSQGISTAGKILWWPAGSGNDTLWVYLPSFEDSAKDSIYFVGFPGIIGEFPIRLAEGQTFRLDKKSTGTGFGYIFGTKRIGGKP